MLRGWHDHSLSIRWAETMPDLSEYIETEDAAKKLNYHVEHVRRMMREGSIKGIEVGRIWLVQRQSLEDYLKRTTQMSKHDPRRTQEKARP